MATVVGDIKPQGELNLLVRPITRGLAIRLTADGEAVQTGAALGTRASALKPTNAVIGEREKVADGAGFHQHRFAIGSHVVEQMMRS